MYRFEVDKNCNKCVLGKSSGGFACSGAISGQSDVEFSQVKLIVISSFPAGKDLSTKLSLAPNYDRKSVPDSNKAPVGGGEYLRHCLETFIDRSKTFPKEFTPIDEFTYFTNAIKCSPQRGRDKITIVDKHRKACTNNWLINELTMFPNDVPILACGTDAVKGILGIDSKLYELRNRVNYYKQHPVIVTTNPSEWEKYIMKYVPNIEESRGYIVKLMQNGTLKKYKKSIDKVIGVSKWKELPGSPLYFIKQDLMLIKNEVIKYIKKG